MQSIVGHLRQRSLLASLAHSGRLPSALAFSGTAGIGKKLVATELAQQLLCHDTTNRPQGGCGECKSCVLLASRNHPDLHELSFGGEEGASVDDVRAVLEKNSLRSFMGGPKVTILNNADDISAVGANIILKSLEEPRPDTFFILVMANPSKLPSTIMSRCQRFFFDHLSPDEIREIMTNRGIPEASDALVALADGSAASLDSLQAQAGMWSDIREVVTKAWNGDSAAVARAAQEWGADKANLRVRLTFLRTTIRQKLIDGATSPTSAAVWSNALQNALDAEYLALERHVNPTLVFLKTLESCSEARAQGYQVTPNSLPSLGEILLDGR